MKSKQQVFIEKLDRLLRKLTTKERMLVVKILKYALEEARKPGKTKSRRLKLGPVPENTFDVSFGKEG